MANSFWLFAVAGGAALLGLAIAFGMIREDKKRSLGAMAGAFIVAVGAVGLGFIVSNGTETAPSNAPDRQGSQYDTPARPSDQNALPGLDEKNR